MKKYLPINKDDIKAIKQLETLSFEVVRDDVPELLTWLQDLNWEVARGISGFLVPYINQIKYDLIDILNGEDPLWKWGVLAGLIERSSEKIDPELLIIIKRIVDIPEGTEKDDYVDTVAKRIIEKNLG